MIDGIVAREDVASTARLKKRPLEHRTVPHDEMPDWTSGGWEVERTNKLSVRLRRPKRRSRELEDRVWVLLYSMGFTHFSDVGGAILHLDPRSRDGSTSQIDVVAADVDVALAVECKAAERVGRIPQLNKDVARLSGLKGRFSRAMAKTLPEGRKRVPILAMFTLGYCVSRADLKRAESEGVVMFNEADLEYYEKLVSHLGPAAKYQLLSDMIPGQTVPGLELSVPALRVKLGKRIAYSFSVRPDYLLKIAYISHRARGQSGGVGAYQRMVSKSRLREIRKYISEGGIFPTNILISLEPNRKTRFEKSSQEDAIEGAPNLRYGTLHLCPGYKSAWIIDGQHRLYAYSGHERAVKDSLFVIAFDGLAPAEQAQLFIDINHEQKSVKRNLLYELYADLHWLADDEEKRVGAIVSKAIRGLSEREESPLRDRILFSDARRSAARCISLDSVFKALTPPGMFIVKKGVEYGPLWAGDNESTLTRTIFVVESWLTMVKDGAPAWWELGSAEGGGLAMNDGVTVCLGVLRSVFQHLRARGPSGVGLGDTELVSEIRPFGEGLGAHLGSLTETERQAFREGARGGQGQTNTRRRCEKGLKRLFPAFDPPGLGDWLELEVRGTNKEAYGLIHRVEQQIRQVVLSCLRNEFVQEQNSWWFDGVPGDVREKAAKRVEQEKGKCAKEDYLDLIDFRRIMAHNWPLFENDMAYGGGRGKEKGTEWMVKLNDIRKVVMHPAKGLVVGFEQLAFLQQLDQWLVQGPDFAE